MYVGNSVSDIHNYVVHIDCVPPDCWRHINSAENPADYGSRGLLPSELLNYDLW